MTRADYVRAQLALLAEDVGRLRAHLPEPIESYAGFLTERVAARLELIDSLVSATAADIVRQLVAEGLDDDAAVSVALDAVDSRTAALRSTLRLRP